MCGFFPIVVFFTKRADINAHTADPGSGDVFSKMFPVIDTSAGVEAHITRFIRIKRPSGKSIGWTRIHTLPAVVTPIGQGFAGFKGRIR